MSTESAFFTACPICWCQVRRAFLDRHAEWHRTMTNIPKEA